MNQKTIPSNLRLLGSIVLLFATGLQAASKADIREISLVNQAGNKIEPGKAEVGQFAVIIFTSTDCPIANRYAPEIVRIHRDYAEKGVRLTLAHVNPKLDWGTVREHASDFNLAGIDIVIDREHDLVQSVGANVTPEAFILNPEGEVLYQGRIDDLFTRLGSKRKTPTVNDLRNALDSVIAGRRPDPVQTKAIGCYIEPIAID